MYDQVWDGGLNKICKINLNFYLQFGLLFYDYKLTFNETRSVNLWENRNPHKSGKWLSELLKNIEDLSGFCGSNCLQECIGLRESSRNELGPSMLQWQA